jgi:tetratricopeptide (TPR) repeat protein
VTEAEAELRKAIEIFDQLGSAFPELPAFRRDAAVNYVALASALDLAGRADDAETAYRAAIDRLEKLSIDFSDDAAFHKSLNKTIGGLSNLLNARGRSEDLANLLKQKASIDERRFRWAVEQNPQAAREQNHLAWLLANASEPRFRDAVRAVAFAKKAVELEPTNGAYWNTLGVAQYRAGDWHEAVSALTKSIAGTSGGNAYDFFFLAMAHAKLGENERSRERFERAVVWMEKNRPKDEELKRFRAEAAELLSAADPPAAKPLEQPEAQ